MVDLEKVLSLLRDRQKDILVKQYSEADEKQKFLLDLGIELYDVKNKDERGVFDQKMGFKVRKATIWKLGKVGFLNRLDFPLEEV